MQRVQAPLHFALIANPPMNSYIKFEQFCKRTGIKLTAHQKMMAMAIYSVFDLHPTFLDPLTGKSQLFKWIEAHLNNVSAQELRAGARKSR